MPSALSVDLRERVIAAIEAGASQRQAAKRFGIAAASAIRWHDHFRQEGRIAPKASGEARQPSRRTLIGSWRCAKRTRTSSCGSCVMRWPSTAFAQARAACGAFSPGTGSPVKRGRARG
jgi:transposase-like protein